MMTFLRNVFENDTWYFFKVQEYSQ